LLTCVRFGGIGHEVSANVLSADEKSGGGWATFCSRIGVDRPVRTVRHKLINELNDSLSKSHLLEAPISIFKTNGNAARLDVDIYLN
jgi:hypothetical protein